MKKIRLISLLLLCIFLFDYTNVQKNMAEENQQIDTNSLTENSAIVDQGTCGDSLYWTLNDKGTVIIDGSGTMINYDYNGSPWYKNDKVISVIFKNGNNIGSSSFRNCPNLKRVIIESPAIKTIGSNAFRESASLESINLPNTITTIGNFAFAQCSKLDNVILPNRLTAINARAFRECASLSSITIPDTVTAIGDYAFYRCPKLASVTLSSNTKSIGIWSFSGCAFNQIELPDTLSNIGDYAFSDTKLTKIQIPKNITKLSTGVLQYCYWLKEVDLPANLTTIQDDAFFCCANLPKVEIPDTVTSMGKEVFRKCLGLTSIKFSKNITALPYRTFDGCRNLMSIEIPDVITQIDSEAFANCTSLSSITILPSVTKVTDNIFLNHSDNLKIYGYNDSTIHQYADDNKITFIPLDAKTDSIEMTTSSNSVNFGQVNLSDVESNKLLIKIKSTSEYSINLQTNSDFIEQETYFQDKDTGEQYTNYDPDNIQCVDVSDLSVKVNDGKYYNIKKGVPFNIVKQVSPTEDFDEYNFVFKIHPEVGKKTANYKTNILITVTTANDK